MTGPSPETVAQMQTALARQEAREHQRRLMQGLGRPIVSFEDQGYRIVCVGKEVHWSKAWRTFPDFLSYFIKTKLTPEWGTAELAKPEAERHPLLHWYQKACLVQQEYAKKPGGLFQIEATGAIRAYLGLAYDLYLCAHNAELLELLLKRLRNASTFEGALYEARVIGSLAKAGFTIELEDETDSGRSHCELTATHNDTGRKFSVEAKAVTSSSSRAGTSTEPPRIRNQLYKALGKQADHERIIFIELNRAGINPSADVPEWVRQIDTDMAQAEKEITIDGRAAPSAYVFVTNFGAIHALDSTRFIEVGLSSGFKIPDFGSRFPARSILELVDAREKHRELHWLRKALQTHQSIPSTFDDRLPEEPNDVSVPRLMIGGTYGIPIEGGQETLGILTDATVLEPAEKAYGIYRCEDGRHVICASPLTDAELAAYRRSPETFFGVLKFVSPKITEPLDCYDFFFESYGRTSKEKLLEFIKDWPDIESLRALGRDRLAQVYCARFAENLWTARAKPPTAGG